MPVVASGAAADSDVVAAVAATVVVVTGTAGGPRSAPDCGAAADSDVVAAVAATVVVVTGTAGVTGIDRTGGAVVVVCAPAGASPNPSAPAARAAEIARLRIGWRTGGRVANHPPRSVNSAS